jgi:hypothetical protein
MIMQGISKRALQWYFKCYCVASVTKTFTLEVVQTIHRFDWINNGRTDINSSLTALKKKRIGFCLDTEHVRGFCSGLVKYAPSYSTESSPTEWGRSFKNFFFLWVFIGYRMSILCYYVAELFGKDRLCGQLAKALGYRSRGRYSSLAD